MRRAIDPRAMTALSAGHLATDFANGALPALLPFLVDQFDLSYTQAGALMLAWAVSSSVVQPGFGVLSDRRGAVWLLPAGVAVCALGIGLAALAPTYWSVLALVTAAGLGSAAYHPEGSKFAAYASGPRRATGMSYFSIGGNVGYALGPIAATPLVLLLGLEGAALLALPGLVVAALLVRMTPFLLGFVPERAAAGGRRGDDDVRALVLLLGVISIRSVAWFGLITFVPLLELARGHSEAYANNVLAAMLLAGGLGTLAAGPAADRVGRRPVLLASVIATGPLILVYLWAGGLVGAAALAFVGVCVIGTFGLTMVMSQEYLPRHIGLASGLTSGLSIGLGGVAAVVLGALADSTDLESTLYVCAAAPFAAVGLAVLLPSGRVRSPGSLTEEQAWLRA